jgi:hypothetical protein
MYGSVWDLRQLAVSRDVSVLVPPVAVSNGSSNILLPKMPKRSSLTLASFWE